MGSGGCPAYPGETVTGGTRPRRSAEYDGLAAGEQHPRLGVPPNGTGQHLRLDVPTGRRELSGAAAVIDPDHVLLDDRALVEVGRHVMRGRADQLHAAVERLLVGPGTLELGRNEWWMLIARPDKARQVSSES